MHLFIFSQSFSKSHSPLLSNIFPTHFGNVSYSTSHHSLVPDFHNNTDNFLSYLLTNKLNILNHTAIRFVILTLCHMQNFWRNFVFYFQNIMQRSCFCIWLVRRRFSSTFVIMVHFNWPVFHLRWSYLKL